MGSTISQRIVERLPWLDGIAEKLHPKVQEVIDKGGTGVRNAADGALVVGVVGGFAAATAGISDWRYLSGGSRRMGVAHGLLNAAGLVLNTASLVLRAGGRRNAGRAAFLAGYALNGMGAHLGGELSYHYGLRVDRNVFEWGGPDEFTPVLEESELPDSEMRRVEIDGKVGVLLSRAEGGKICAVSATCNHMGGPLEQGDREATPSSAPGTNRASACAGAR